MKLKQTLLPLLINICVISAPAMAEPDNPASMYYTSQCSVRAELYDPQIMASTMADPYKFKQFMMVMAQPDTLQIMMSCASNPQQWQAWMSKVSDPNKMMATMTVFMNPMFYHNWMSALVNPSFYSLNDND